MLHMGKTLRITGITFMSLTAFLTLIGGAGTTCVALGAENYDSMAAIEPYKWLYILFVLATITIGVMMVRAVVLLIQGRANAYRYSLISMVFGIVVGGIHMAVSRSLRGSSMPVDAVVYITVLTLIIFLLFHLPPIWQKVNDDKAGRESGSVGPPAVAISLLLIGLLTLTVQFWAGPSHTFDGANWADAWHLSMNLAGWWLVLSGAGVLVFWLVNHRFGFLSWQRDQSTRTYRIP
jgi:hypothetical protein